MSRLDHNEVLRRKHEKLPHYPEGTGHDWDSFMAECRKLPVDVPFVLKVQRTPEWNEIMLAGLDGELPTDIFFGITAKREDNKLGRHCFCRLTKKFGGRDTALGLNEVFIVDGLDDSLLHTPPSGYGYKITDMLTRRGSVDMVFGTWLGRMIARTHDWLVMQPTQVFPTVVFRDHLRVFRCFYQNPALEEVLSCIDRQLETRARFLKDKIFSLRSEITDYETELGIISR